MGGPRVGLGGQGGCERRIEVFMKIQKKNWRGGGVGLGVGGRVGGGVRVDVNEELKFCENSKKNWRGGGGGVGLGGGGGGVRVDVNEELKFLGKLKIYIYIFFFFWGGVRGVGLGSQGGCERRIEVFVKIRKKNWGGGVVGWGGGVGSGGGGGLGWSGWI